MSYSKIYLISVPEEGSRGNGEIIVFGSFASINKCVSSHLKGVAKYQIEWREVNPHILLPAVQWTIEWGLTEDPKNY